MKLTLLEFEKEFTFSKAGFLLRSVAWEGGQGEPRSIRARNCAFDEELKTGPRTWTRSWRGSQGPEEWGPGKGGRQVPDPLHRFAWAPACVRHMCTHAHTRTQDSHFSQSCLSNSPTRASVGPGGRGGPPCPRNLARTPNNPSLLTQAAQETKQETSPGQPRDGPRRVRLTAGLPKSHRPVLALQASPKEKSSLGCSCHICREGAGTAEQHLIPGSLLSPPAQEAWFSRWQPRLKHEDGTVPQGC